MIVSGGSDDSDQVVERRTSIDRDEPPAVDATAVRVIDNRAASRFEILVDDEVAGYAEYRRRGAVVSFTHTAIDPRFTGRGLGPRLAAEALATVRDEGSSVKPFCPFIRDYIQRHPELLDLVPADQRARFHLVPAPPAAPT